LVGLTDILFAIKLVITGSGFRSSQIIEEVTEIKIDRVKGNTKSKRISDIRNLYINNLKKHTDAPNKEIADLLEIGSSTVTNVLSGIY
jgi:chromosomal replication initiation ATPase DnaA